MQTCMYLSHDLIAKAAYLTAMPDCRALRTAGSIVSLANTDNQSAWILTPVQSLRANTPPDRDTRVLFYHQLGSPHAVCLSRY